MSKRVKRETRDEAIARANRLECHLTTASIGLNAILNGEIECKIRAHGDAPSTFYTFRLFRSAGPVGGYVVQTFRAPGQRDTSSVTTLDELSERARTMLQERRSRNTEGDRHPDSSMISPREEQDGLSLMAH